MCIITNKVKVSCTGKYYKYYLNKGYNVINARDKIEVLVKDLPDSSHAEIECKCNVCNNIFNTEYRMYIRSKNKNKQYICNRCAKKISSGDSISNAKLLKSISFEEWCVKNNKTDILKLWDYSKNTFKPNEICYSSKKKVWFKCPRLIHESELKTIKNFVNGFNSIRCLKCESFAQYLIDNYGNNALDLYWDYKLNSISPYDINKHSNTKVWIRCTENKLHKSYQTTVNSFYYNHRCPYCNGKKVIKEESLGYFLEQLGKISLWSDRNKLNPYELTRRSNKKVWFKCENEKHADYQRNCNSSFDYDYRCPKCQFSKGEDRIMDLLDEWGITYTPQKTFDDLIGDGLKRKRKLRFDFYINDYNIAIEYQGRQHEESVDYFGGDKELKKRKRYDDLKREYCKSNNIDLLEIWYYDFDIIDEILYNKLKRGDI